MFKNEIFQIGSNLPQDKSLCDLQIVVLSLGVLFVHFMSVCEVTRDTEYIFLMREFYSVAKKLLYFTER